MCETSDHHTGAKKWKNTPFLFYIKIIQTICFINIFTRAHTHSSWVVVGELVRQTHKIFWKIDACEEQNWLMQAKNEPLFHVARSQQHITMNSCAWRNESTLFFYFIKLLFKPYHWMYFAHAHEHLILGCCRRGHAPTHTQFEHILHENHTHTHASWCSSVCIAKCMSKTTWHHEWKHVHVQKKTWGKKKHTFFIMY